MWISGLTNVNSFQIRSGFTGLCGVETPPRPVHRKAELKIDQAACKPGSVHRRPPDGVQRIGDHSSGTTLADRLAQPTRTERYGAPAPCEAPVPIRSCSRRGLPCRPCFQERGALLPHPFTLASRRTGIGGLLSVALSLGSPVAQFTGRALPAALPSWSPDFPPAGCPASGRPAA